MIDHRYVLHWDPQYGQRRWPVCAIDQLLRDQLIAALLADQSIVQCNYRSHKSVKLAQHNGWQKV